MIFSFIGTAAITFLAIVVGYFTRSLPETLFNRVDFVILHYAEAAGRRIAQCFGQEVSSTAVASAAVQADEAKARKHRSEALRAFILTLSDQQLVTGLAILIAGFSAYCSISTYHFNIVASLAWFSSTTHLSTLAVLRDYLISHPTIRTWRMIGMFGVLGLLFPAVLVSWSSVSVGQPVQCTFAELKDGQDYLFVDYYISLSATCVILVYLVFVYGNKFVTLFTTGSSLSMSEWFVSKMRKKAGLEPRTWCDDKLIEYGKTHSNSPGWVIPLRYIHMTVLILPELERSFCWQILLLIFGNVYGIVWIYVNRWMYTPEGGVDGNENAMGFGQYVALLLLALPLLAAREAYDG